MLYKILFRETLSIIALFAFFLLVLVAIAGLAYILKEFASPVIRDFFKISQLTLLSLDSSLRNNFSYLFP